MIINGVDYETRIAELTAAGIPWDGTDDTVFGVPFVFCGQHLRAHTVGWCTVRNVEKVALEARTIEGAEVEAEGMRGGSGGEVGAGGWGGRRWMGRAVDET